MTARLRRSAATSALCVVHCALCIALTACIVEGPPMRDARAGGERRGQPDNLRADSVVLTVSQFPEDTDADGYADTILATAHLFSNDPRYPLPITPPGSMRFYLLDNVGNTIAEWRFAPETTTRHRHPSGVGIGYVFRLDLATAGAERIAPTDATLRCEFIPEIGVPAESRGGVTIALGPIR